VQVDIVAREHTNALIIPTAALVDDEGDLFVMVAGEDNKAHRHPVAVGLSTRTQVEITSGISAGDRVIVRGQDGLPEGAAISIEPQ
jgi:multidrug efflux pump subunit AcrA (membrane-fusion protein)